MRRTDGRIGFTLFSLITVLWGMGLLSALFFPALLRIREASQRMRASSNMRQLGIGLHHSHLDANCFPGIGNGKNSSWCYAIARNIELDPDAKEFAKTPVPLFHVVMRRKPDLYNNLPKIDFAGCTGNCDDPAKPEKEGRGIFHTDKVSLDVITNKDGTSNTIMLGPKRLRISDYTTGKGLGDEGSCWTGGTSDTLRSSNGDKRPLRQDDDEKDDGRGFGSPFRTSSPFVMADGSVRNFTYKIKGADFRDYCNWDGGVFPNDD